MSRKCERRQGFTYIECLTALLIAAAIFLPLFSAFRSVVLAYHTCHDRRIAESRIRTVDAILRNPLFYCGLGIPSDSSSYKKAFGSQSSRAPFSWSGPITVTTGGGETDGCLQIAFAYPYPGGCLTDGEYTVGTSASSVTFTKTPDTDYFNLDLYSKITSVKNWVLFVNSYPRRTPMTLTSVSGKTLKMKNYLHDEVTIPKGDKLLLFRALKCWAEDGILYTNDYRTTGNQPRVYGICDIRFEIDGRLLTVYIVARGDNDTLAPGRIVGAENCRSDIIEKWDGQSQYVLYCEKIVYYLCNIGDS